MASARDARKKSRRTYSDNPHDGRIHQNPVRQEDEVIRNLQQEKIKYIQVEPLKIHRMLSNRGNNFKVNKKRRKLDIRNNVVNVPKDEKSTSNIKDVLTLAVRVEAHETIRNKPSQSIVRSSQLFPSR